MPRRNSARRGHRRRGGGRAAIVAVSPGRCFTPSKKHYRDKRAATVALARVGARRLEEPGDGVMPVRAYECGCGGGWCLTSQDVSSSASVDVTRPWKRQGPINRKG